MKETHNEFMDRVVEESTNDVKVSEGVKNG